MFMCEECISKDDRVSLVKSFGSCEVCGKRKVCYDVHIHGQSGFDVETTDNFNQAIREERSKGKN